MQNLALALDSGWFDILSRLPADLDLNQLARDNKAIQRLRGITDAADLLRLVPPVIDFAVNLRIDSSVTTEILRDRETNCCEKVCGEA
jgi:hypothetical protein